MSKNIGIFCSTTYW